MLWAMIMKSRKDLMDTMKILYKGKYSLLTKHRKSFIEADYEGAYSANRPYDEFKNGC